MCEYSIYKSNKTGSTRHTSSTSIWIAFSNIPITIDRFFSRYTIAVVVGNGGGGDDDDYFLLLLSAK